MYKCIECGHLFDEGEQQTFSEDLGEYFGNPIIKTSSVCPICKGVYEKTISCEICGAEHLEDELIDGVCEHCLYESSSIEDCFKMSKDEVQKVSINAFIAELYTSHEIEQILFNHAKKTAKKKDIYNFIDVDKTWFAEKLKERESEQKEEH